MYEITCDEHDMLPELVVRCTGDEGVTSVVDTSSDDDDDSWDTKKDIQWNCHAVKLIVY